jgi:hypothetical protein
MHHQKIFLFFIGWFPLSDHKSADKFLNSLILQANMIPKSEHNNTTTFNLPLKSRI